MAIEYAIDIISDFPADYCVRIATVHMIHTKTREGRSQAKRCGLQVRKVGNPPIVLDCHESSGIVRLISVL